jgi:lipoprotein-releasing system permease protein
MNLPFFIAKRYLVSKKSHNAINIISIISVLAISLGTMALVIVLSGMNGLTGLVRSLYNAFDPDIMITSVNSKTFDPNSSQLQSVRKLKDVAYFSQALEENALLKYGDQQCLATIKGVSREFSSMTRFDTLIYEGSFTLEKSGQSFAVIGIGLGYLLNARANDLFTPVSVYAPKRGRSSSINPEDGFNKKITYISGIFTINDDFDKRYAIVPLKFAQELLGYENQVSAIEIGLKKGSSSDRVQEEIKAILGKNFEVKNRYEQNEILFKTLKSEKLWTFIILIFILIIATFNVIGSLTMLIIEKKKDISILWNMGMDIQQIRKVFLLEGMLITFIGAATGLIMGIVICWAQIEFHLVKFDEGYVVDAYPVKMEPSDFLMIMLIVLTIGLFAAWYPVRVFTRKYQVGENL